MDQETGSESLTPNEEAFFESGGKTDPESGTSSGDSGTETTSQAAVETTTDAPVVETKPVEQQKEKTVPLAALHQARMEMKELKERNAAMEQQFQQFQQMLHQRQQQEQQQMAPTPDTDPVGYFQHQNQLLTQQLQQLAQGQQQFHTQQQQQQQEMHFQNTFKQHENMFASRQPDYHDAARFLQNNLVESMVALGHTQQDAQAHMQQQVRGMIAQAMQFGNNPAELAYTLAMQRGYRAPQQQAQPAQQQQVSNTDKIAQINKGQVAAKSLSSSGGKSKGELTLEAMADMDEAELEANWKEISKLM